MPKIEFPQLPRFAGLFSRLGNHNNYDWVPLSWNGIYNKVLMLDRCTGLTSELAKIEKGSVFPEHDHTTVQTLVIKNYLKPGDKITLVFNSEAKGDSKPQVSSYLSDPKAAVTLAVQFAKLPDGPNHVAGIQVDRVSKHMTVAIQNSNYQNQRGCEFMSDIWRESTAKCFFEHEKES